ncbi:MAG: DNA repair protein RecO C-terminal domain-containing protein [Planctomycetes bacterium]|nr:DNA repair protein RecO C-terminal domain-containing protein [Planctomycetota bacterium]
MRPRNNRLGDIPDEFDISDMTVYGKANSIYSILVENNLVQSAACMRRDWTKYAAMASLRELLAAVWRGYAADEDDAWKVYQVLSGLLLLGDRLDGVVMGLAGVMRILDIAGVAPQIGACVLCGRTALPGGWVLSWKEGGLLCPGCSSNADAAGTFRTTFDAGLVELLRRAAGTQMEALVPLKTPSMERAERLVSAVGEWASAVLDTRVTMFTWFRSMLEGVHS